jgi:hypothetical protein
MRQSLDSLLNEAQRSGTKASNEALWNLFVQILLPLIMILTFLATLDIARYKTSLDVAREESKEVYTKWTSSLQGPESELAQAHTRLKITRLELQRAHLVQALTAVRNDFERNLGLERFSGPQDVSMESHNLADERFARLCLNSRQEFAQEQKLRNSFYQSVLAKANYAELNKRHLWVHSHSPQEEDLVSLNPLDGARDEEARQLYSTDLAKYVAKPNRAYIHNRIIEAVRSTKRKVVELQGGVLDRLYTNLLESPDAERVVAQELGQEEADRLGRLTAVLFQDEASQAAREQAARELYALGLDLMAEKIEKQGGYTFLAETWQQVSL